jgi:uncharacterized repeat protein (TIGR01451 family)
VFKIRAWVSAVLAAALVVLGGIVAVSASAHTPSVVADCDQLAVTLTSYNGSGTNTVKVTIGGDVVEDATFGASFQETYDAPDKYKDYAYEVAVTAHDDPTGSKGWTKTFTGTSKACKEPGNGHTPVNVCHATNSDSNPYVFITVDDDSVKLQGHLMHRQTPNKTWKSDGVWRGTVVHAGDAKPDLIGDYTDKQGVKHTYDGVITSKSDCGKLSPPEVTKPTGSYDQECVYGGVQVTIGQLDDGTYSDVTWTFTHGNVSSQVSSGDQVLVQSGEQLSLSWASGESTGTAKSGVAKDCPPPVVTEPSGSFEQECVEGGVRVTITGLDAGTSDSVTWSFTHGGTTVSNVTEGQQILVQSGEQLVLAWNSSDGNGTAKSGTAKECPPPVQDEFGKIKIKKDMEGPVAGASTTFTVRVDCPGTAYDQDVVLSSANSWVATTGSIPTGTVCSLTEVKVPNGWNPEGITPDTVTVGSGTPSQVSAVALNKRRTGRVHIHKTIVGDPAGASTTFTVHLDCDGTAYDQDVVLSQANQWTFDKGGFPSGIDCRVTEPSVPAGWTLTSVTPSGAFTIDSYDTITVEVVNTRTVTPPPTTPTTGVITVTKVLEGAVNGADTSFVFDVDCPGTAYDQKVTVAVTNGTSASGTTGQIPTGSTCTVTERSTSGWQQKSVVPANGAVAVGSTVTFTNSRRTGALAISKAVTPVAGNGVVVGFGDTLTYTMTVSATGSLTQSGVVVTDYVPGSDPARPGSAATTYKAGSAACIGAGTCTVTGPDAHGLITWQLGDMAAGSSRQVTFQVTVDEVTGDPGETVAVDVLNAAAVRSASVTTMPSNEVSTPVTEVLPVKQGHKPPSAGGTHLPHTGAGLPVGAAAGMGGLLVLMGLGLVLVARPRNAGMRRA